MGVIKRQSIKQGLVTYLGIIIGTISTLFIYPRLSLDKFGDIQFIIGIATFFAPFMGIGLPSVAIHFFHYFKDDNEKKGRFLFILLRTTLLSLLVFMLIIYFNRNIVSQYFSQNAYLFLNYMPYILGISFCLTFINLLQAYIANFNRIVIPSILYNLTLKILQPTLVIIFLSGIISFTNILDGLVIVHIFIVLATAYYLYKLGHFKINTNKIHTDKVLRKQIIDYSLFSILINVSGSLALQIDKLLIGLMVNSRSLAIFTVPVLITEAIDVVRKAISGVAAPIISDSIKNNDIDNVNTIYKKSALLQLTMGMFLLIGAWVCADDLYNIMPKGKEFAEGKILIMILGISRLIDMMTGANTEIIGYSNYYRANLYMLIFLSVINISSNYILIPLYGNVGAAYATLLSMFFFNAAKLIFIYNKMNIHPFSNNMLKSLLAASIVSIIAYNLPIINIEGFNNIIVSIIRIAFKGIIISIIYFILIWRMNVSEDINQSIDSVLRKFKRQ